MLKRTVGLTRVVISSTLRSVARGEREDGLRKGKDLGLGYGGPLDARAVSAPIRWI